MNQGAVSDVPRMDIDIICGRYPEAYRSKGTVFARVTALTFLPEYERERQHRSNIRRGIIIDKALRKIIHDADGQVVRGFFERRSDEDSWVRLSESEMRMRVGHWLRDELAKRKKKLREKEKRNADDTMNKNGSFGEPDHQPDVVISRSPKRGRTVLSRREKQQDPQHQSDAASLDPHDRELLRQLLTSDVEELSRHTAVRSTTQADEPVIIRSIGSPLCRFVSNMDHVDTVAGDALPAIVTPPALKQEWIHKDQVNEGLSSSSQHEGFPLLPNLRSAVSSTSQPNAGTQLQQGGIAAVPRSFHSWSNPHGWNGYAPNVDSGKFNRSMTQVSNDAQELLNSADLEPTPLPEVVVSFYPGFERRSWTALGSC